MKNIYVMMIISSLLLAWTLIQACNPISLEKRTVAIEQDEDPAHYQLKNENNVNTRYEDIPVFILKNQVYYISGDLSALWRTASLTPQTLESETKEPLTIFSPERGYRIGQVTTNSTGDVLYYTLYRNEGNTLQGPKLNTIGMELFILQKSNGQWTKPKAFIYNNISEFSVGQAALSLDDQLLYFVSDMPGGMGGTDIWYSTRRANGTWSIPLNAGPGINTPWDEVYPVVGPDGTLYYSTNGLTGIGGFDIFKAKGKANTWTRPKHLGAPVNSAADDFSLLWTSRNTGVFGSNRNGGKGGTDIYAFQVL